MTRREEAEQLRRRSNEFLESSELQMGRRLYSLSVFSMEQAVQLFLKSKLLERGAEFPRTHSVKKLMKLLSEISEAKCKGRLEELLKNYALELGTLEDAYITSRYGVRDYEEEEAKRIVSAVKVIVDGIGEDC